MTACSVPLISVVTFRPWEFRSGHRNSPWGLPSSECGIRRS
jgi:hypothetical protein